MVSPRGPELICKNNSEQVEFDFEKEKVDNPRPSTSIVKSYCVFVPSPSTSLSRLNLVPTSSNPEAMYIQYSG